MTGAKERPSAGAIYDGEGNLVAGVGPPFSVELVSDLAFQAVLHELEEPGTSMEADDRMWVVPERHSSAIDFPEHVLADLAATIRAGRKVLVMAHDAENGDGACDAIERMLGTAHGNA